MTDTPVPLTPWLADAESQAAADHTYHEHQSIELGPITDWMAGQRNGATPLPDTAMELFSGALFDFSQLCEEIRFELGVGVLYLTTLQTEIDATRPNSPFADIGIPVTALALLTPYAMRNPAPSELLKRPEQAIAGHRVLGGWWAGQLFDSALIRSMSAMDRLATLLYIASGLETSNDRMPAFRRGWLGDIKRWLGNSEWDALVATLDHPVFKLVKRYRDGFVHQQRSPSVLHGGHAVSVTSGAQATKGVPGDLHMAMVRGFFEQVLRPTTKLVTQLLRDGEIRTRDET